MDIDLIETFLDLAESRSFNRTAERLALTQSTVSARIAALERSLGRKLFARSRAGTELTSAGNAFLPHALGLRHGWTEAMRATRQTGNTALSMRIGLQTDLADRHVGDWVSGFRRLLPETAFYLELDYSNQMCTDLMSGRLDLAVMFTPRTWPDLHFESVGEVNYRLVSSDVTSRAAIDPARYIAGSYSPSFDKQHATLFPELGDAALSSGQNRAIVGLLDALGGTGFVLDDDARALVASGRFRFIEDAPAIPQTVYAAIHLSHRHEHVHRRLVAIIRQTFSADRAS